MLEYEIEIGKEEQDALLEITLQSDGYRKRRKVVTITSVIMCIICLPSGMLSFMLGRAEIYILHAAGKRYSREQDLRDFMQMHRRHW